MSADPTAVLRLTVSARTEELLDALADWVDQPVGGPTYRECIVVQSRGMARWLELMLSARFGIWANAWFPFPEEFADSLWRAVQGSVPGARKGALDRDTLGWAVAAALPALLDDPAFEPLGSWVGAAREPGRVLALARRIGSVYHGYLLSRPDLLLAWEDEPLPAWLPPDMPEGAAADAAWQAPLWRAVVAQLGRTAVGHPARRLRELAEALEGADVGPDLGTRLGRVSVFGLSALSSPYLRSLAALARHVPVQLFSLAPSPADARLLLGAARQQGWRGLVSLPLASEVDGLYSALPETHPFLVDQAGAVRSFHVLAALAGAELVVLDAAGSSPLSAEPLLLARLQADVAQGLPPTPCPSILAAVREGHDRSLGLHSCYGPLREVEVLRDQLLAAFDELPGLAPHEVVVMAPDVEVYAPYVEAIFGTGQDQGTAIPFRMADRPPRADRPGVQAFERLLHLLRGRMTAPEVLDLLALAPVRAARGLDDEAIDRLRDWIEDVGIRWGLDAEHRAAVGQPSRAANTWQWGLRRLALGWAAPGDGRQRFAGVLPFAAAGGEPALLGQLAAFVDLLARWRDELLDARWSIDLWAARFGRLLPELIGEGSSSEEDRLLVEAALGGLVERAQLAGFEGNLGLDAVTTLLGESLAEDPLSRGFLEGAVTVCSLQPMRAIPFRVVALLGMNDGDFPRTERPPSFDLAARQPRLGDTPRRSADRLLFLEALVCARERFLITWSGRDARTDRDLPPSVLVSELQDVLRTMAVAGPPTIERVEEWPEAADGALTELVLRHPLHPFSRQYFNQGKDPRWFSYSSVYADTASRSSAPRKARPPLSGVALAPPSAEPEELIPLAELARFLESPARRFVRDRLNIALPEQGQPLADREPMTLEPLDRYQVGEAMLAALLEGLSPDEAVAIAQAEGRLPLGTPGTLAVEPVRAIAERLAALTLPLRRDGVARTAPVELTLSEASVRLTGSLAGLWPAGRLELGYGTLDLRRELRLWVRHLALNVALGEGELAGCAPVSWAVGRAGGRGKDLALLRLGPVADAREQLLSLVVLWQQAATGVVPFFPLAARAYAKTLPASNPDSGVDDGTVVAALRAAAAAFGADRRESDAAGARYGRVDVDDAYLALALGDAVPWDPDGGPADPNAVARFQELASAVFGPLEAAATRATEDEARALVAELGA